MVLTSTMNNRAVQSTTEDVCPWESVSPPGSSSSVSATPNSMTTTSGNGDRMKNVHLLTAGPSVEHEGLNVSSMMSNSAVKSSTSTTTLPCSRVDIVSSDLDVCPWESTSAVLPSVAGQSAGRTKTPVALQKSSTEVVASDDVVCPWESQALTAQDAVVVTPQPTLPIRHPADHTQTTTHALKSSSEVTVITLNPSKQISPIISPAGGSSSSSSSGSGHRRKESASGITVLPHQQHPPESHEQQQQQPPQLDKSSAKISDICPWEDE